MKNRIKGIIKRVVSGLSAAAMMMSNIFPAVPITASAEAAHTINVFDINLKSGADYYSTYTPDDLVNVNNSLSNAYVWQADSSNAGHKFVYNIKLSISGVGNAGSGEEATKENFIKIRIPEHILKFSSSTATGNTDTVEMPVPKISQIEYKEVDGKKVYATDHQFVYDYDKNTKEYVIFNIAPVSAGVVYEFPVAYIMDKNTWEYEDLGSSAPFKAKVDIASWDKSDETTPVTLTQTTREIPVYVDTAAEITKTYKKAEEVSGEVLISANEAKSKMGLDTVLSDDYKYVVWSVVSDISDVTQKYSLELADAPTPIKVANEEDINGEVVAVKMGSTVFQGDKGVITGLTASGKRTDYVLTRYSKAEVEALDSKPKPATYTAQNNVTMTLTPADGKDKPSVKQDNAVFQYEVKDPTWHPVEVSFSAEKFGLYNNGKNRVSSKSNISSYSLSKLAADGETVSGLQYETKSTAHAYGKTIRDLEHEITELIFSEDRNTVTAGDRKYVFASGEVTKSDLNGDNGQTIGTYTEPLTDLDKQIIIGRDIADTYYGQQPLDYILDDKTFSFADINKPTDIKPLTKDDYCINSVSYSYLVRKVEYDADKMEFSAGKDNEYDNISAYNILEFYVYDNGSDEPVLVGSYDLRNNEASIEKPALVKSITADSIVFADDANITGYRIKTSNKYFYVELKTRPSITLKASDTIKPIVGKIVNDNNKEKKVAVSNTCKWTVKNDDKDLLNSDKTATDYIADIIRKSSISKKALGEKTYITGQDGKVYRSSNDTLIGQYQLAWQTTVKETADGIEVNGSLANGVPVAQQSGVFYDLLPSHSDIIEGSVNVYVDAAGDVGQNTTPLPSSSFKVYERKDNYNGSGKKLLKIEINAPCNSSYTVTYVTVHSHEDIQDYGSFALNTVAYQTGNEDIGNGYPDDGGNYAVSMSAYIKGLDPENGSAKRFIYAEATEDILALFPTSSGIYKKVSTQSDPSYRKTGVVHNGETYTYNIRMKNDSSTKATDIAILDSVENFRKVGDAEKPINSGLDQDRGWYGTIVSFDLKGIEDKMGNQKNDLKLILYTGDAPVNLDDENYSDVENRKYVLYRILGEVDKANDLAVNLSVEEKAKADAVVGNWKEYNWENPNVDLEKVTAFIVYLGEQFTLEKGDSLSFTVKMQAPEDVKITEVPNVAEGKFLTAPETYNNVYRSFTSSMDTSETTKKTYFYTHYDYTQVRYSTVGTVKFSKRDSATGETIPGVTFNLSGISDYGTAYNETLVSDGNGVVTFTNLERGTYQLIESKSDDDHLIDATPRTVMVDPKGRFTFVKVDGSPMIRFDDKGKIVEVVSDDPDIDVDYNGSFSIKNDPRYHGDFKFRKVDSLSGNGIGGTKFTLSGTSMYNTVYTDLEAESDANGNVVFENLEKGTYTLTETAVSSGYLPPENNTYTVTCTGTRDLIFKIEGEGSEYKNGEYRIKNTPTAEMILQKVDSITKDTLDDAQFTLTADDELNATLAHLTNKVTDTHWEKSGESYVQTVNGSNIAAKGCYSFGYLPEGKYTLTETAPPTGYAVKNSSYTIDVVESSDGKRLVIKLPDGGDMQYIKIENGDFVTADEDTATLYRLTNDQTYEDGKTLVKSWVGGVGDSFPSMHLSSEKPEAVARKVTIDKGILRTMLTSNSSNVTAFTQSDNEPSSTATDAKDHSYTDETGEFKIWKDGTTVYWWSNADIIYFPSDCSNLFQDCTKLKTIDFSYETNRKVFSAEKVVRMGYYERKNSTDYYYGMFKGCTSLTSVDLSCITDTPNLTTAQEMFNGCSAIKTIHLENWANAPKLENISGLFTKCKALETISLNSLVATNLNDVHQMLDRGAPLKYAFLGKSIAFKDLGKGVKINSVFVSSGASDGSGVVDLSGWDTTNATTMDTMFKDSKIKTVYVSEKWNTNSVTSSTNMFDNATKIKGGNGTTYVSTNKKDKTYARIDQEGTPGYFTYKEAPQIDTSANSNQGETNQGTGDISNVSVEFADYPKFKKEGDPKTVEYTPAQGEEVKVGETSFTFECVTEKTTVPANGTEPYEVPETIFMTVSQIVEDGGAYYTVSQKYKYNGTPVKAKWTEVGGDAPTQWKCEMKVFNADDEFFAWESAVSGFTSTADENSPIRTVGRSDEPVITNAKTGTSIGSLELTKTLQGGNEKYVPDSFWFKVTMKENENKAYTMLPFDSEGVAYFKVRPNVANVISGIPAGCTYTVEEADDEGHSMPIGYSKVTENDTSGSITANTKSTAQIENRIDTADLTLSKLIALNKITKTSNGEAAPVTDTSDKDYVKWAAEDFSFTITFENLVAGQEYSYVIDGNLTQFTASDSSAETVVNITLKGGQTVELAGIPVGTKYTIVETSEFEDTEAVKFTTVNDRGEAPETTGEQTLSADGDTVTFTNTKQIDETLLPEYVEVTVNKEWLSKDSKEVKWLTDDDGNVVKFSLNNSGEYVVDPDNGAYVPYILKEDGTKDYLPNFPSFLKIYLGRALAVPREENGETVYTYLDVTTGLDNASINVQGSWSKTFTKLDKYGEIVRYNAETKKYETVKCEYVYFVSEVTPVGYGNTNTGALSWVSSGEDKYFQAMGEGDEKSITLKNKAEETFELTVCKLVTGNFGNKAKDFDFEIELSDSKGKPISGTGVAVVFTDMYNNDAVLRSRTYTLEQGKLTVKLPHGVKIKFVGLPKGINYTIKELNKGEYTLRSGTYKGSVFAVKAETLKGGEVQSGTLTADTNYVYMNDLTGVIPTGIGLSGTAAVIVFFLTTGGIAYLLLHRRKEQTS